MEQACYLGSVRAEEENGPVVLDMLRQVKAVDRHIRNPYSSAGIQGLSESLDSSHEGMEIQTTLMLLIRTSHGCWPAELSIVLAMDRMKVQRILQHLIQHALRTRASSEQSVPRDLPFVDEQRHWSLSPTM
jgi:hypothetical protein